MKRHRDTSMPGMQRHTARTEHALASLQVRRHEQRYTFGDWPGDVQATARVDDRVQVSLPVPLPVAGGIVKGTLTVGEDLPAASVRYKRTV